MTRHAAPPRLAPRLRRAAVALAVTALVLLGKQITHQRPAAAAAATSIAP